MEDKSKSSILADALRLRENSFKSYEIDANSPTKIIAKLNEIFTTSTEKFIINITGGTKMMSQITHDFFKKFPNTKIYYWPIEYNYVEQVFPEFKEVYFEKQIELDLTTYLAAHGYSYIGQNKLTYKFSRADELFSQVIKKGDSAKVTNIRNAFQPDYSKSDKNYLIGGWFEEWLYTLIKKELNLKNSQIAYNLKLKSQYSKRVTESDNEIDIAFVYKNTLYVIECKVFAINSLNNKKITDTIYKISSIRQSMGLKATAFVNILSNLGKNKQRKETIKYLTQMAQVKKVFSIEDMNNKTKFIKELKNIVNYEQENISIFSE